MHSIGRKPIWALMIEDIPSGEIWVLVSSTMQPPSLPYLQYVLIATFFRFCSYKNNNCLNDIKAAHHLG
jgi:hypothetical protein